MSEAATHRHQRDTRVERVKTVLRAQKYALPFWQIIVLRLVLEPVGRMMPVVVGFIGRYAVENVFPTGHVMQWVACTAAVFGASLVQFLCGFTTASLMYGMASRMELSLRDKLFNKMMGLTLRFHGKRPVGENVFRLSPGDISRFNTNITMVGQDAMDSVGLVAITPVSIITHLVQILMVVAAMLALGKVVTIMVVLYVPCYMIITQLLMTYVRRANRESRIARQAVEARAREAMSIFRITKAFCRQFFEESRFYRAAAIAMRKTLVNDIWGAFYTVLALQGLTPAFMQFLFLVGGLMVLKGEMRPGDYVVFPAIVSSVIAPVSMLVVAVQDFRLRFVPVDRVRETLEAEPEVMDAPDALPMPKAQGAVEFRGVRFAYEPGKPVLRDLSFKVEPGQKVAFVGPSGAGKTSIVNLIMRFYDPDTGAVLVDGRDIRSLLQSDLRSHIGMVLQDNVLFSGTVESNIRYGKPSAAMDEIRRAAITAGIHDFIETLPGGYQTHLSETTELSGGQKQRIAIARALIREPRILILDEATSAVDPLVEREVINALNRFAQGRTLLVIAHNLINVRDADKVFVVERGRIVQEGTHAELMAQEGLYRSMWAEEQAA